MPQDVGAAVVGSLAEELRAVQFALLEQAPSPAQGDRMKLFDMFLLKAMFYVRNGIGLKARYIIAVANALIVLAERDLGRRLTTPEATRLLESFVTWILREDYFPEARDLHRFITLEPWRNAVESQ